MTKLEIVYKRSISIIINFVVAPMVTLMEKVNIENDQIVVFWEYKRRKQDSHLPVTIRVKYRKSGDGNNTSHPPESEPAVSARQGQLTVPGDFSTVTSYEVKLAIYEGDVQVPSLDSNIVTVKPVTEGGKCNT